MSCVMVYITARDAAEAEKIGKSLVESRLAACVNIIDGMKSMYWWEGAVQSANETVILAKTRETVFPMLMEKVKAMHGYECPCIVAFPIKDGFEPFMQWIENETK